MSKIIPITVELGVVYDIVGVVKKILPPPAKNPV